MFSSVDAVDDEKCAAIWNGRKETSEKKKMLSLFFLLCGEAKRKIKFMFLNPTPKNQLI